LFPERQALGDLIAGWLAGSWVSGLAGWIPGRQSVE